MFLSGLTNKENCKQFYMGIMMFVYMGIMMFVYMGIMMFVLDKSRLKCYFNESQFADMAELADAPDLGSGGNPRAGSSPVIRTKAPRSAQRVVGG